MNLQGRQDRKYMSLNILILEDNLHVEYTIFIFSLSAWYVMCLFPVAHPEGVQGVRSNPPLELNYFIFMEVFFF